MNYGTFPSRLLNAVDSLSNPRAQMFRAAEGWQSISSEEFLGRIAGLSTAFVELGVRFGGRVGMSTSASPRCLDGGHIDLLHRHHRLKGTLCLAASGCKRIR